MNLGHFAGLQAAGPLDRRDGRGNLRDLPPIIRRSNWTLGIRDRGRIQWSISGGTNVLSIPSTIGNMPFPEGFSVPLVAHVGSLQITPGTNVTLQDGTTTGAVTLTVGQSRLLTLSPFIEGAGPVWRLL